MATITSDSGATLQISEEQLARVKKRHDYFYEGAKPSYNYNFMVFTASVIASLGLASNSSAIVIASMLISPIMGPVLGMAYGTTVTDWHLVRISLRTELISLLVCIVIGAIIGACTGWTDLANDWLTDEMYTRGTWQNLLVGLPIAFFSGLAVAVSVLNEQSSSLVGVAISASLLPPACNAGLIWVTYAFVVNDILEGNSDLTKDEVKKEFREGGAVSLLLSVANIILIFIASVLAFHVKWKIKLKNEKAPFWNDLSVARKIYHRTPYGAPSSVAAMDDSNEQSSETAAGADPTDESTTPDVGGSKTMESDIGQDKAVEKAGN